MKRFILFFAVGLLFAPETFARQQSRPLRATVPGTLVREQSILARVTVYWASGGRGSDRYTRRHKCATGMRLRHGHCAVDPKKIPYGSQVVFPDGTSLAAVDTGTAVKNRKAARKLGRTTYERSAVVVDRFFETKRQALAWANRNPYFMTVRVIPPKRGLAPVPAQAQRLAGNSAHSRQPVSITAPRNPMLVASNSTIVRNPLNKLGR